MKKILALTLTLIMILGLATTAFATDITIDDGAVVGAEYKAYKLLNATDGGDNKFAYTVNTKYLAALRTVVGDADATEDEIVAYISAQDTAEETRIFADAIYAQVKDMAADYNTATNVFSGVDQGYYLIVETATGSVENFEEDTFSLVMLDTAGKDSIKVETKEELPESEKKIKDTNDSTGETTGWQDSADYDIGDTVPFQITFTLPKDYAAYKNYFVGVHDVQAEGLTYNKDMKVTVNGTDITEWFDDTEETDDTCTFHFECADIVAEDKADESIALKAEDEIVFTYTATLNENAKLGSAGNPNEMYIEFSNNPYGDGTSETPKDKVVVFTYKVNVDKYAEEVAEGNELTGAMFTLYKEVPSTTEGALTGAAIKATLPANVRATALDNAKYYIIAQTVETDADGDTFGFKGVDDGNYVLVETLVPAGYNAWSAVAFEISAEHEEDSADPKLTELTGGNLFTGDVATNASSGILDTDIVNNSGTELPSTGGIGTTIFYIVGGMLAVAAVVLLVTKKRMAVAE